MSASASAKDYGQALTVRIWNNASAPHSNGIDTPEQEPEPNRLANTSDAELYIFPADTSKATGQAVVICPGGGYGRLAIDHEGYEVAQWLAANGITGAVLKYRMPNHHPEVPLEDAEQALPDGAVRVGGGVGDGGGAQAGLVGENSPGDAAAHGQKHAAYQSSGDGARLKRALEDGRKHLRKASPMEQHHAQRHGDIENGHERNQPLGDASDALNAAQKHYGDGGAERRADE